jgi:hypothetical protein
MREFSKSNGKQWIMNYIFETVRKFLLLSDRIVILGGIVFSVFAIRPKVRGLKPGIRRWIFKGDKNLQHAFLSRVTKSAGPM